jgi:CHAT domain-containing protein/tetratricopeptide (TPR) repeat protein
VGVVPAAEPAKQAEAVAPSWQRLLQGKDAQKAAQLEKKLDQLHQAGQLAEALEVAEALAQLRRKVQGADHWQTVNARFKAEALRRVLCQGEQQQKDYARSQGLQRQADELVSKGRYPQAQPLLEKVLAIRRKVLGEDHPDTAQSYDNLATSQQSQGQYPEAEEGFRKALAISSRALGAEHPLTAQCYNNLAMSQQYQGRYAQAEESYRTALALRRKVLGEEHSLTAQIYHNLALSLLSQGKYQEAEDGYRKALALQRKVLGEEHPHTALSYSNLALNQDAQGKYKEAEESYRTALALRRKALGEEHPLIAQSYDNLAYNQNAQGKYREGEALWLKAADGFARARLHSAAAGLERAGFSSRHSPLPSLAAVLARNGKPHEAWQRHEESLSRGTWDDLSARLRRPRAERDQLSRMGVRIQGLSQRIEQASRARPSPEQARQRNELLRGLRQAYDEQAAFLQQLEKKYGPSAGQVFEQRRIQAALPGEAALLGWLDIPGQRTAADPGGEHWAILLRARGEPVWVRLSGSGDKGAWTSSDTELPGQLRAALQRLGSDWQALAQRLRKQRLQPVVQHLEGIHHLIVLPSTALAGVPVEIIAPGYTVSYAPSGTLYAHLRQQHPPTSKELLALADPVFDAPARPDRQPRGDWRGLPGTRFEAAALERLFAPEPTRHLLDSDASEQRLDTLAQSGELGRYRYLHLATHGEVDNRLPLRSALILARDQLPDPAKQLEAGLPLFDGRLSAEEILQQWHLDSDLVTLSACRTALGKYEQGEGFVGFAQALILAGSRSVCLSLWKVDDAATALLMERFYQNLLGKRQGLKAPMAKAQALAEAKSWLRQLSREEALARVAQLSEGVPRGKGRKLRLLPEATSKDGKDRPFDHPYYWAAFVLIGQPD